VAVKVQVIFYSMYGHVYKMAEAVAEGARSVEGVEVSLLQVPELVPDAALERTGAKAARAAFAHVPMAATDKLPEADAIIATSSTRPAGCGPKAP
jgi:multimeric flavodoxin WrbA